MKKYFIQVGMFAALLFVLTGLKKNTQLQPFASANTMNVNTGNEMPELVIAETTTIQGDKGQTPVEIMVCLSKASSEAVTMKYSTENGTAISGTDYIATKGAIRFEPGEIVKWITVQIVGEVAADPDEDAPQDPDEDFKIVINEINGAFTKQKSTIITIIKNIARNPRFNKGPGSAYQVVFEYRGYTTLGGTLADCHIRRNGRVYLIGILEGDEKIDPKDPSAPVFYSGKLYLNIDMDICSVEHSETTDPPDRYCYLSVAGLGYVATELEMDPAGARYSYIKIDCDTSKFYRIVVGDCFSQIGGELQNVPNNSIASIFNGFQLDSLTDANGRQLRTLRKGVFTQRDKEGNVTKVTVARKLR